MPEPQWVRAGVKGALVRDGRLLLLLRRKDLTVLPDLWDLPGGSLDPGRSLQETLAHHFLEETGFRVRVGDPLDIAFGWIRPRGEPPFPSVVASFLCFTRSNSQPRLDSSEHAAFRWVTRRQLPAIPVPVDQRPAMERAMARRP